MKKYKWIIILLNLLILFISFNYSIFKKETLLSDGELILLKLVPVDPRSLMQGDYMELRYDIADDIQTDSISKRGFCVVKLTVDNIAKRVRIQENKMPLKKGEYLIKYTAKNWQGLNIGAESFFFQEGEGKKYEAAKYGAIKVDDQGNSLLIGLFNQKLKEIK